jgi:hypothetical protein
VSDTVDGDAYPVHKASGAETPGYGDPADGAAAILRYALPR